ncbi:MAG: CHAP domain-containing protein [Solirubrobacterales bacterium]
MNAFRNPRRAIALPFALAALLAVPAAASAQFEGGVQPGDPSLVDVVPKRSAILKTARAELARNVRERKGDNVPRYDFGKGPITPYSIRDQWCVAFSSWTWQQAGYTDYLGTRLLRTAFGGTLLAIQVTDLARWAKRTGHWTLRATPGDLVAYGGAHIGVVTVVDRQGRAVKSIEGNKDNAVRPVVIEMSRVTGYVSPSPVTAAKRVARSSALADVD